ncbi:MAG: carbon-nitrogen hydrolase family protein [Bacteroidales bacterium]|nr:carbon-nitrogen hydrolase family protein [Bacteroidales bacterium]
MNKQINRIRSRVFLSLVQFTLLILPLSGQKLSIATCQFPVSDNIEENAGWIIKQMEEAHAQGATLAHFPECALSGYPGVDMLTMESFQWNLLHGYTDSITALAQQLDMWVLLGSIHELSDTLKPLNSLYVINPSGKIIDRYDKRFCTKGDLKFFSAGNHFVVFNINGIRCGLLICFDVRFPELYREYKKLDVDLIFQSFYNARQKPGGIHPKIMPLTAQTRAATNHFYMSLTNSSAANSWPCHFITPDGLIEDTLPANKPGVLISELDLSESFYDASKDFRKNAMEGKLYSEKAPEDPRYENRQGR